MVFEKPDWDFRRRNFDTDVKLATAKMGQALDATDTNRDRFKAAGGKLIQVHGWSDAARRPPLQSNFMKRWPRRWAACRRRSRSIGYSWPPACNIAAAALVRTPSVVRLACRPMHDAAHDVFNAVSAVETASVLAVNVLLRHRRQSAFAARRA
jgi:hypothetical protein